MDLVTFKYKSQVSEGGGTVEAWEAQECRKDRPKTAAADTGGTPADPWGQRRWEVLVSGLASLLLFVGIYYQRKLSPLLFTMARAGPDVLTALRLLELVFFSTGG